MTTTTLRDARADYYRVNGFAADGGDSEDWVPIKLWKLTIPIPNGKARKAAVKIHDLHHVVTGYQTDLAGEGEIGAWEIGSGCASVPVAFVLNCFAITVGMIIAPRRMVRAFARGRASQNLYGRKIDDLLDLDVVRTRTELEVDNAARPGVRDVVAPIALAIPTAAFWTALVLGPILGVIALISAIV
jgi:hypothetical protein